VRLLDARLGGILASVRFAPSRIGLFLRGDRVIAAAIQGNRAEAFVVEAEQPATALRAELDQRQIGARTAAIGLARGAVTVKPIELPSVDGEILEMVRFELERHLPAGNEDAAFDCVPLPTDGATTGLPVLIAAADRRLIDQALRFAEEARLRPVSVTVASHNLVALVTRPRSGRIVWVHRVGDDAEMLLLAGPALVMSRSVAAADEAAMVEEVRRSLAITRWRTCDAVWLSGDATPDTVEALGELGAPVTEPPFTPRARAWLGALGEPRGELALAVAVAAGGRFRPLELLPPALRPRHLTRTQLVTVGTVAAVLLLGLIALLVPGYRSSRQLAHVNAQVAGLDAEVRAVERLVDELERRRGLLAAIESIEEASVRPLPVLRELTDLLPGEAWLTMLSLDTKGAELTGQAQQAAALIPLLENSRRFERVEFSSPVTRGRDREQFRIRAAWEGGAAVQAPPAGARPSASGRPAAPSLGPAGPGGRPR
jgi:Tfp pilus assembly protein PilN